MGLWYQNSYTDPVYVAILWFDSGCSGQPWRKSGWYQVAPGSSVDATVVLLQPGVAGRGFQGCSYVMNSSTCWAIAGLST